MDSQSQKPDECFAKGFKIEYHIKIFTRNNVCNIYKNDLWSIMTDIVKLFFFIGFMETFPVCFRVLMLGLLDVLPKHTFKNLIFETDSSIDWPIDRSRERNLHVVISSIYPVVSTKLFEISNRSLCLWDFSQNQRMFI